MSYTQIRRLHDVVKRKKTGKIYLREGAGGRSSNHGISATVFGATGFLGRYLVNSLGKRGTEVVTPYRGIEDSKRHLKLMGDLGQIVQPRYDIRDEVSIVESLCHADVVYNLVGRSFKTKNFSFEDIHIDAARRLARLARENNVSKFIHVSALGASEDSKSAFLKTKWLGEQAVREEFPDATIVRPSRIYGHEDWFFSQMGFFAKFMPFNIVPIVDGGVAKMRPVFVNDVAAVLDIMLKDDSTLGQTVELYGPKEYYYKSLVEMFVDVSMRQQQIISVPKAIAKPLAKVWGHFLWEPIVTPDEIERFTISDAPKKDAVNFKHFGIHPHTVEETIIRFAARFRPQEFATAPYEPTLKKYTTKDVNLN